MKNSNLISRIIPPVTREYRENFDNHFILDSLSEDEISIVENQLINMLSTTTYIDDLVLKTLIYIRSIKSIDILLHMLSNEKRESYIILLSTTIYQIDNEKIKMKTKAFEAFKKMKDPHEVSVALYRLSQLNDIGINEIIKSYVDHKNIYLASAAKDILKWNIKD